MNQDPRPHSFQTAAPSQGGMAPAGSSHAVARPAGADIRREPFTAPGDPIAIALAVAIRGLIHLQVPRVRGEMDAADFIGRIDLLEQFAAVVDPVIETIAREAAKHSDEVCASYFEKLTLTAMHDRALLSQLESAAGKARQGEHKAASSPFPHVGNLSNGMRSVRSEVGRINARYRSRPKPISDEQFDVEREAEQQGIGVTDYLRG